MKHNFKTFDDYMKKKPQMCLFFFLCDESQINDDQKKWSDWVSAPMITGKEERTRFPWPSSNDLSCHLSTAMCRVEPELSLHLSLQSEGNDTTEPKGLGRGTRQLPLPP